MSWRDELNRYFEKGAEKGPDHELGVEIEHFIVKADTLEAIPYKGEQGVRAVLERLMDLYPGAAPIGKENILGFETADFTITLEPAAQLEISMVKTSSIGKIRDIYSSFRKNLDEVLSGFSYKAITAGCQPVSRVEDLELIPKERYRLMDRYFKDTGDGGIQMMRGTCSVQVSVDYYSEEDFRRKIRAAYYYMPLLKLLADNSKTFEGKKLEGALKRTDIWSRTDGSRYGIQEGIFEAGFGFDSYTSFLGNMPLIYMEGEGEDRATGTQTVSQIYEEKDPDEKEIRHILSMAFPDVRLKSYLEIRFADSMPEEYMTAYTALLKGLLYDERSLDRAEDAIREGCLTEDDIKRAEESLMLKGWDGYVYGKSARSAARDMVRTARMYLPDEEKRYIDVFRPVIDAGGIAAAEASKKEGRLTSAYIRSQYADLISSDMKKNMEGALALKANMERSPLYFRDRITSKTLQIPRIYTKEDIENFRRTVKTSYGIFDKVIREYIKNAEYRKLFPFSKELEDLILIPNGYSSFLPIARFDIFYHEDTGDFYFCEINTDGTSGMNEDRLQDELILDNPAHQVMRRRYLFQTFELFDSWVKCFLELYGTYEKRVKKPNVAIVDFLDGGTVREFQEFARHFQRAGVDCEICDIRELSFKDKKLYSPAGNIIDAIYRRAVTTDIMDHMDEVAAFLTAVREGACFVAGSFATQIIHHKWLFYVLHHEMTGKILTEEENEFVRRHVPVTLPFAPEHISRKKVLKDKDAYILKPDDSYASNGVWAGVEFTQAEWEEKVDMAYDKGYICQEYCPQYSTENIDFAWGDGNWHSYISMAGLYVYNGDFAGVFARCAEGDGIIASHRNERTQVTYMVSEFETV
ncbi:MAG: hypothetical protein K6F28_04865 [Lachnospiraceae bacterium]|nr:hypothetical protein [Lachnospiraceae bacterium]